MTMRFRKARGKKPAIVTMTEADIVEACHRYLDAKGVVAGTRCWLKINTNPTVKRRGTRVEFACEIGG